MLRIDFVEPTNYVSVAFLNGSGLAVWSGIGTLTAFDAAASMLGAVSTHLMEPPVGMPPPETLAAFSWPAAEIDHVLVSQTTFSGADSIRVRSVTFNTPEPAIAPLLLGAVLLGSLARRARRQLGRSAHWRGFR